METKNGEWIELRPLRQVGDREWVWMEALQQLPEAIERLHVTAQTLWGEEISHDVALRARVARLGHDSSIDDLEPGWEVHVEPHTFFEDVAVRMQPFDSARLPLGRELRSAGMAVAVEAREAATNQRVRIRVQPPAGSESGKMGLFYVDRSGNLQFLSAQRDDDGALVGRARYLSVFAVLEDTTPPRLTQFRNTTKPGGEPRLHFSVTDTGADLDDEALSVSIDGTFAIAEWDPETTRVSVTPTVALRRGTHTMQVIAVDQLGNRSERTWQFDIP